MKKYLGLIKIYEEHMAGTGVKLLSKTYDDVNLINLWFNMYPNQEHIILENNEKLDSMFETFEDMTPVTEEEKESMNQANKLYKKIMDD